MSAQTDRCDYCQKRAYPVEKTTYDGKVYHIMCLKNKDKETVYSKPPAFSVSEQIFCNPQRPVGRRDDVPTNECYKCYTPLSAGFCTKCKTYV